MVFQSRGRARIARSGSWGLLRCAAFALVAACVAGIAHAAPAKSPDIGQRLGDLGQAQQALAAAVDKVQGQLGDVDKRLRETQEQLQALQDGAGGDREQLRTVKEDVHGMREEVRGLYVESSSTKDMVGKVGDQVAALSASLERFRFAAGLLLAVLLGLQMVAIALAFRSR